MPKKVHRNLYHLLVGILFPLGYHFAHTKLWPSIFVGFLLLLMLVFETTRFLKPGFNKWVFEHVKALVKESEKTQPTGTTFFLTSVLATIIFFPKYIAVASLTFLALGDVAAACVGEKWGKIKMFHKSLEGTLTFFGVSVIAGWLLHFLYPQLTLPLILWGSLTAAVVEVLPLPVDDNFSIPLITSFVMWLLAK
ncbi:MAG TPA: hypothetical protein ENG13_03270 [bacterium]|nr:hypothetical protein [bacterium]HEX68068.1 hypothetical protein [bacterium]